MHTQQYTFHWVGVAWIVISVAFISSAALSQSTASPPIPLALFNEGGGGSSSYVPISLALMGVCHTIIGTVFQSCQYVLEERFMRRAVPAPPWLIIGMEGFWGTVLCIFVMFPAG